MKQSLKILLILFSSCVKPSYYKTQETTLNALYQNDYAKSATELEKNSYLKESYNQNLYKIEKGRLLFLMGKYEEASKPLIEAELSMEDWKTFHYRNTKGESTYLMDNRYTTDGSPIPPHSSVTGDYFNQNSSKVRGSYGYATSASFKSPRKLNFVCNDYERPLINFYVGLCGVKLQNDMPFVEAKRLDLVMQNLDTRKFPMNPGPVAYATNPFIPITIGIFYESMGDYNNALIAYEKAIACFENKYCYAHYGVKMPNQLLVDVLSLLKIMGFADKIESFTKKYPSVRAEKSEILNSAILILEEGFVPAKDQEIIWYYDGKPSTQKIKGSKAQSQSTKKTRVIIQNQHNKGANASIGLNQNRLNATVIMNMDYAMNVVMKERIALEDEPHSSNVNGSMNSNILNNDTRNWQNLPSKISYCRVPLSNGNNNLVVNYQSTSGQKKQQIASISKKNKTQVLHFFLN